MEETTDTIQYEYIKEKIARIIAMKKNRECSAPGESQTTGLLDLSASTSLDTPQMMRLKKTETRHQKILDTYIDTPNKPEEEPTTQELMQRGYSTWYSTSLFAKDKKYAPVYLTKSQGRPKERIVGNGVYGNLKAMELSCMKDTVPILQFSSGEMKRLKKNF
jgi:hypothetical protein